MHCHSVVVKNWNSIEIEDLMEIKMKDLNLSVSLVVIHAGTLDFTIKSSVQADTYKSANKINLTKYYIHSKYLMHSIIELFCYFLTLTYLICEIKRAFNFIYSF